MEDARPSGRLVEQWLGGGLKYFVITNCWTGYLDIEIRILEVLRKLYKAVKYVPKVFILGLR